MKKYKIIVDGKEVIKSVSPEKEQAFLNKYKNATIVSDESTKPTETDQSQNNQKEQIFKSIPNNMTKQDIEKMGGDLSTEYGTATPERQKEIDFTIEELDKRENEIVDGEEVIKKKLTLQIGANGPYYIDQDNKIVNKEDLSIEQELKLIDSNRKLFDDKGNALHIKSTKTKEFEKRIEGKDYISYPIYDDNNEPLSEEDWLFYMRHLKFKDKTGINDPTFHEEIPIVTTDMVSVPTTGDITSADLVKNLEDNFTKYDFKFKPIPLSASKVEVEAPNGEVMVLQLNPKDEQQMIDTINAFIQKNALYTVEENIIEELTNLEKETRIDAKDESIKNTEKEIDNLVKEKKLESMQQGLVQNVENRITDVFQQIENEKKSFIPDQNIIKELENKLKTLEQEKKHLVDHPLPSIKPGPKYDIRGPFRPDVEDTVSIIDAPTDTIDEIAREAALERYKKDKENKESEHYDENFIYDPSRADIYHSDNYYSQDDFEPYFNEEKENIKFFEQEKIEFKRKLDAEEITQEEYNKFIEEYNKPYYDKILKKNETNNFNAILDEKINKHFKDDTDAQREYRNKIINEIKSDNEKNLLITQDDLRINNEKGKVIIEKNKKIQEDFEKNGTEIKRKIEESGVIVMTDEEYEIKQQNIISDGDYKNQKEFDIQTEEIIKEGNIPSEEEYIEGGEQIKSKWFLPTEEERNAKFEEIKSKHDLTTKEGAKAAQKEWSEYENYRVSQANNANKELEQYQSEYKEKIRIVNEKLKIFSDAQTKKNNIVSKKLEELRNSQINNIEELNKLIAPELLVQEDLRSKAESLQNISNVIIDKDEELRKKLDGFVDKSTGLELFHAETLRTLSVGNWRAIVKSFSDMGIGFVDYLGQMTVDGKNEVFDTWFEGNPVAREWAEGLWQLSPPGFLMSPFDKNSYIKQLLLEDTDDKRKSLWEIQKENHNKWVQQNWDPYIKRPLTLDQLMEDGSSADWSEYVGAQLVTQIPIITTILTTGGWALPIISASAGGQKYAQLKAEKELYYQTSGIYGYDHSFASMALNATVSGAAEGAFEYVTAGILGKTITSLGKIFVKEAGKEGIKTGFRNILARAVHTGFQTIKTGGYLAAEAGSEGVAEALTAMASNWADIEISGKRDVSIWDNVDEAAITGAMLGGVMQSPRLLSIAVAPFKSFKTNQKIGEIAVEMQGVIDELKKLKHSDGSFNPNDKKKIDELTARYTELVVLSNNLVEQDIKRVDLLHPTEKKALIEIEKRNHLDKKKLQDILTDTKLSKEERTKKMEELVKKMETRRDRKQTILDKYPPNVVDKNYKNRISTLKATAKMAQKMGAVAVNFVEVKTKQYQELIKKYQIETRGQSESMIKVIRDHFSDMTTGLESIINDKDSTVEEVAAAKQLLKDAQGQVSAANNILKSNSAGVMQPKFDKKGRIVSIDIIINEEAVAENGLFNTASHEFIHAVFANILKFDPKMRAILGSQLKKILSGKGITFKPGMKDYFWARIEQYDSEKQGEEMMAIASEMLLDGDIMFNDSVWQKLKNFWRRFAQNYLKRDIKFDTIEDLKNFMRDYHHSIKNNKPNKAIARLLAKGPKGRSTGKMFKDAKWWGDNVYESKDGDVMMENKVLNKISKKLPDWKDDFDQYTQNEDGSKTYKTREEFQNSGEIWDAYKEIEKSKGLKNFIKVGVSSETGIKTAQEMDKYVNGVIDIILDKFKSGPTALYKTLEKQILEQRDKNEITAKETAEMMDKLKSGINPFTNKEAKLFTKGFDAFDANGSLFGWLTNTAVPFAKKDYQKKYVKETLGGVAVSTETKVNESQTIADRIQDEKSSLMEKIDNADMSHAARREAKEAVKDLIMVMDLLNLPSNVKKSVINNIKDNYVSLEIITDPKGKFSAFKNIRNLIINKEFDPKVINPKTGKQVKTEKSVIPIGPFFESLNAIASEFGVDPLRMLASQDLSAKEKITDKDGKEKTIPGQRDLAKIKIFNLIVNEDGSFNTNILRALPKGADRSGRATGVVHTVLGQLYTKGGRAKMKGGATAAGLAAQVLRTDITKKELLNLFGINEDGSLQPGRDADGAIRELIIQLTTHSVNQQLELTAIKNKIESADAIARLKEGKDSSMLNEIPKQKKEVYRTVEFIHKSAKLDPRKLFKTLGVLDPMAAVKALNKGEFIWTPKMKKLAVEIIGKYIKRDPSLYYVFRDSMTFGNLRSTFGVKAIFEGIVGDVNQFDKIFNRFEYRDGNKFLDKQKTKKNPNFDKLNQSKIFKKDGKFYFRLIGGEVVSYKEFSDTQEGTLEALFNIFDVTTNLGAAKAWFLKAFMKDSSSNMNGLQRSAAKLIGVPINPNGTIDYNSPIREEHMFPQNGVGRILANAFLHAEGNPFIAMKIVSAAYAQMPLRKNHDGMVDEAGYKNSMPDFFWKVIAPRIADGSLDYLPPGLTSIVRYTASGVDLNGYQLFENGQTITEFFGVNIKDFYKLSKEDQARIVEKQNRLIESILAGKDADGNPMTKTEARKQINAEVKKHTIKIKDGKSLSSYSKIFDKSKIEIDNGRNLQNETLKSSNAMSSKIPPKVQGMSTFDLDDTLIRSKSGVQYTMPNPSGKAAPKKKVIFLAGGPGSGKSNVVKKLGLEKQGFKIVNQDISLQWLTKNHGLPANMNDFTSEQASKWAELQWEARDIAQRKKMKFQGKGDGVVIDGTGAGYISLTAQMQEFQNKGYDVQMVFVETDLKTAIARNKARKERSLKNYIVVKTHKSVMANKDKFKKDFGDNFVEVNTNNLTEKSAMPPGVIEKVNDFTKGYIKGRLTAEQFANQGAKLQDQGAEFDFSEFNKIVEGEPGPYLQTAINRAKKYGTKDIFVLTARPQAAARTIQTFLMYHGLKLPLKNITGLGNSTGQAKADWMLKKFAEGYNDMYFVDDAFANVDAVQNVLNQLDIKSKVVQAKLNNSNRIVEKGDASMESKIIEPDVKNPDTRDPVDKEFNDMIERKKGIDSNTIVSQAEARKRGSETNITRFLKSLYIPPSAEDFKGLLYYFVGKGKQGDADLKWFKEKLFDPFAKGIRSWNAYKQNMVDEYKALKKKFPSVSKTLNKKVPGTIWTNDTAIRMYLWNKAGFDIPGIDSATVQKLIDHVNNNPDIKAFADGLSIVTRSKEGYPAPTENWSVSSIPGDMNNLVNKISRKEFLQEWINMKNVVFSKDNLNKIRAIHGDGFADALDNILYRMEHGGNRTYGKDKVVGRFTNWINSSVGAVMFFNMRSALLQTISTVNFINWSDNNIFKASKAFANVPQFWSDFAKLFNSPQLKQRRRGLQIDVSASELQKTFAEKGFKPGAVIDYLLQIGFTPTQIADSFAIAFGGASFFRNRYNKYIKEGMNPKQANDQAMLDFQEIAEETQQSSREDLVSQQQASPLGRIILAFQNVTMQMGRLTKKALSDLRHGRGDMKTNISKIIYYGMVQNIVFASLQTALAMIVWGDDEEEIEERTTRTMNQALDSFLRGTGLYGALLSTLKNTVIQWHLQSKKGYGQQDTGKIALDLINLSPPIGSKIRKIISAFKTEQYNKGVSEKLGWRIENPEIHKWASIIEAVTNIPLSRVVNKANNLEEAITGDHLMWQRIALAMGWNRWSIGVKDEELEAAKTEVKEEKKEKKKIIKEQKKIEEKKVKEEEKKKEEERKKKEGIKTVRCSGTNSSGQRCGLTTETKAKTWKCFHHSKSKEGSDRDGDGIKEYQCRATTSSGRRCKNKTENTNKKCYAHQ